MRKSILSATLLFVLVISCAGIPLVEAEPELEPVLYYEKDFRTATSIDEWVRYSGGEPALDNGLLTIFGGTNPVLVSDVRLDLPSIGDFELTMTARLVENSGWGAVLFMRMDTERTYGQTGYQLVIKPTVLELGKGSPEGYKLIQSQSNPVDFSHFHTYRIRMEGNNLKVWIDDVPYFDYTDTGLEYSEIYSEGRFACKGNRSTLQIQTMSIYAL